MLHLNGTWRDQTKSLIVRGALALGIATTALGAMAAPACALDTDDLGYAKAHEAYNFTSENSTIRLQTASEVLPDTFDLRDRGVVTPVKFQTPGAPAGDSPPSPPPKRACSPSWEPPMRTPASTSPSATWLTSWPPTYRTMT